MDDLPVVVLREIFSFLSIQKRFEVKLTCKKWKFAVETMSLPKSLCIYSIADPYKESWCFSDQRIAEEEVIYMKFNREKQRKFDLKMDFFKNLQKLCLYSIGEKINDFLEELNGLTKLEVLMIWDDPAKRITLRKLSSSSLRKLSIKNSACRSMELDTPNLHSFALYDFEREELVNISFPLRIKHLQCREFTLRLSRLKNLETLLCHEITFDFKLKDFKSLVKLEIFPRDANELEFVKGLQKERTRLGRDRLEIIVSGFKEQLALSGRREFSSHYRLTPSYLQNALQNSSNLVGHMPWAWWEIEIPTLLEYADSIPRSLLDKITIRGIFIHYEGSQKGYRLTDTEQSNLVKFIRRSEPSSLDLSGLNLNREFYEQISEVQSIHSLVIGHRSEPCLEELEFENFLKLKNLSKLFVQCFNEKVPLKFLCALVQLEHFINFEYRSNFSLGTGCEIMIDYDVFDSDIVSDSDESDEEDELLMTSPYHLKVIRLSKRGRFEPLFKAIAKDPHELARELTKLSKLTQCEESKYCLIY